MKAYLFITILLISIAIIYIKIAERFNIVDKPNHRSSHTEPIIRGAGIIFYFALFFNFVLGGFKFPFFITGVTLLAAISYIDDLISLSSKTRLVFQFTSISLCIYQLSILTFIPVGFFPLLLIIGVGFINIFNFMDGINGITGVYSLVAFTGLFIINVFENLIDTNILIYLIISILIFGYFNFRKKARFFSGDIGSITLAAIFFFLITFYCYKLETPIFILLMSVYLVDAILTIMYRKFFLKENITEAHRYHIYQKLTDISKFPHLKTSLIYALLQAIITAVVILVYQLNIWIQIIVFVTVSIVLFLIYMFLFKRLKIKK
ncbi:MAG: UDP-GlcNAc--UDP-phosphate GlcNAc-1-phosphate transferase [Winogradskyella sp.]|nr:MAG: UDP-GlcNAc--UDP-phosphate GlcNAc-1-phosphate transferase [Winogradskyella sp.]